MLLVSGYHNSKFIIHNSKLSPICAISTAPGVGGIAIIRLSGDDILAILHPAIPETASLELQPRRATYVRSALDDMVLTFYPAPHSYTGEDVLELACHGSTYIQQELLHRLIDAGARLAEPGEFTRRAFLAGKLDLTEAEAVADLIASSSRAEQELALRQLRGGISTELSQLRDQLLEMTSLLELELDFSDHEELEFADRTKLLALLDTIDTHITTLMNSFRAGNAIRNGIAVAIVGPTNAGKSTLLNAILGYERAIVSDIAGTTRDTVEESLILDGLRYRFIDTAGLRNTTDPIESLGIHRTHEAAAAADIVIAIDCTPSDIPTEKVIAVHNKSDISTLPDILNICAKSGDIASLITELTRRGKQLTEHSGNILISNARHYEALRQASVGIARVRVSMEQGLSGELVAEDLRAVLEPIGSITGQYTSDEVLGNIFSKFCIGK